MNPNNQQKLETAKQLASKTLVGMLRTRWRLASDFPVQVLDSMLQSKGPVLNQDIYSLQNKYPGITVHYLDRPSACKLANNVLLIIRHTENFGSFLLIKIWKDQVNG